MRTVVMTGDKGKEKLTGTLAFNAIGFRHNVNSLVSICKRREKQTLESLFKTTHLWRNFFAIRYEVIDFPFGLPCRKPRKRQDQKGISNNQIDNFQPFLLKKTLKLGCKVKKGWYGPRGKKVPTVDNLTTITIFLTNSLSKTINPFS